MIRFAILDAEVRQLNARKWAVIHPSNGAILAYADSATEATMAREAINDMPRTLRGVGHEVA